MMKLMIWIEMLDLQQMMMNPAGGEQADPLGSALHVGRIAAYKKTHG